MQTSWSVSSLAPDVERGVRAHEAAQTLATCLNQTPNDIQVVVIFFKSCGQLTITVTGVSDESDATWLTRKR
jgi:hypothetical protein